MAQDFPNNPTLGQVFGSYVWNGTAWAGIGSANNLATQLNTGYRLVQTLYYTSSGTFTKANYPWLRAIKVKVVGGGGGSGSAGSQDAGNLFGSGGGGGGGGYAEKFITDIGSVASSVTVTVGAGGAGGTGSGGTGGTGGTSSFGSVSATAGQGGLGTPTNNTVARASWGGFGGSGSGGDINIDGQPGGPGISLGGYSAISVTGNVGGNGGASLLSGGSRGYNSIGGNEGKVYGGGASGPGNTYAPLREGSAGASGIVIVELYA